MKQIVLLRGVNIGDRTVKSDELKACFAKAGFKNPKTVLATGNVIIDSNLKPEKLQPQIETLLFNTFDFSIKVLVIPYDKLKLFIENYPFKNIGEEYHCYVIFKTAKAKQPDFILDESIENIMPNGNLIYWYVLKGHTLDSNFAKHLAKESQNEFSTTRNINTLNKIIKAAND